MSDIIKVAFEEGQITHLCEEEIWQWNKGLKLQISGLETTEAKVQVHFSLEETQGLARRVVADVVDGVIHTDVPAFILEKESTYGLPNYEAYAWIYLVDGDFAETVRKIIFRISTRAKPDTYVKDEDKSSFEELEMRVEELEEKLANGTGTGGKSAYEYAKDGGYTGTEEEFAQKLAEEYVKTTDYAKTNIAGVVRVKPAHGVNVTEDGYIYPVPASTAKIDVRENYAWLTPSTLDYAIKVGLSDNQLEWTEQEKAGSRKLIDALDKDTLLQLAIKQTAEKSTLLHIQDSADFKVQSFEMEGKTEQASTTGKNLCNLQIGSFLNDDGSVIERKESQYATCSIFVTEETEIMISVPKTEMHGVYLTKAYNETSGITKPYVKAAQGNSGKYILHAGQNILLFTAYDSVNSLTVFKPIKVQIELGSTATAYEPYTGGQPSPNPDYPQEIVNAGVYNEETGRYEIGCSVVNKNLIHDIKNGYIHTQTGDLVPNDSYRTIYARLPKGIYTFTVSCDEGAYIVREKKSGVITGIGTNIASHKITVDEYTLYEITVRNINTTDLFTNFVVQIEPGSTSTECTPHESQLFTLTSPVPITKWDKLVKRDGVWGWSIWSKEYNLSADEVELSANNASNASNVQVRLYIVGLTTTKQRAECFCNIFRYANDTTIDHCGFWFSNRFCMLLSNKMLEPYGYSYDSTVDNSVNCDNVKTAFKALLEATGGIQVWADMREEQSFHPLPNEEQEILNNLATYYPTTIVTNDQDCPMQIQYVADTKNYIDQKLLPIQSAMI